MAKLFIFRDGAFLGEFPLKKKRVSVGRLSSCDIQIDSLAVSNEHLIITLLFGKYTVADMGSTNGTLVNGKAIEKTILQANDVIEVGNYRLKFVEQDDLAQYAGFEQTVLVQKETARAAATKKQASSPTLENNLKSANFVLDPNIVASYMVDKVKASLTVISGTNQGRVLQINKPRIPIGWPGVQVADVITNPQGIFIKHSEGLNYPVVNGTNIGSHYYLLNDADEFELAGVKMAISIKESKGLFAVIGNFFKNFF